MVSWTEDTFGEFGKTDVCWECFYCAWRDLWWFMFSGVWILKVLDWRILVSLIWKQQGILGLLVYKALYILEKMLL